MAKNRSNRPCRIEDELYLKLKFLAQQENRSFNNYVENLFIEIVKNYEDKHGEIKVNTDELYE